jgi:hypothetical protein
MAPPHGASSSRSSSSAERDRRVIDDERRKVGQRQHVTEQEGGPLPAVGFAPDDTQCRGALRREHIPGEERQGGGEAPVRGQGVAEARYINTA